MSQTNKHAASIEVVTNELKIRQALQALKSSKYLPGAVLGPAPGLQVLHLVVDECSLAPCLLLRSESSHVQYLLPLDDVVEVGAGLVTNEKVSFFRGWVAAMEDVLGSGPRPGEMWAHYKGNPYQVLAHGLRAHDMARMVIYRLATMSGLFPDKNLPALIWARELGNWREKVSVSRFRPLYNEPEVAVAPVAGSPPPPSIAPPPPPQEVKPSRKKTTKKPPAAAPPADEPEPAKAGVKG
jgi:hypothetical protein